MSTAHINAAAMTNPRQLSLVQARELLHSHSDSHSHPQTGPRAHVHDYDLEQSQQQHSHQADQGPRLRGQESDAENISPVHVRALPVADADATIHVGGSIPLVTQVTPAISLVPSIESAGVSLVLAPGTPPLPHLLPTDASDTRLVWLNITLFPNTSASNTDSGASLGATIQVPTPIFINATITANTTSSTLLPLAIPAPSIPSIPAFTAGSNSTNRFSAVETSSAVETNSPNAVDDNVNSTQHNETNRPKKLEATDLTSGSITAQSLMPTITPSKHASKSSSIRTSSHTSSTLVLIPILNTPAAPPDGGAGVGTTAAGDLPPGSTTLPSDSNASNLTPQQKKVVGGVVGTVAGVAILAVFIILLLRHRRRRDGHDLLGAAQGRTFRSLLSHLLGGPDESASGHRSGAGETMVERYNPGAPLAGSSAGMVGKQRPNWSDSSRAADGGERGFYRVSGRKLPSVLEVGGDGYTDPRDGAMGDNNSHSYGDTQSNDSADGRASRLALGKPMRPVSGVPIIRSGPARMPVTVTEQNPFADPASSLSESQSPISTSMSALRDSPVGSRFYEVI